MAHGVNFSRQQHKCHHLGVVVGTVERGHTQESYSEHATAEKDEVRCPTPGANINASLLVRLFFDMIML